MEDAMSNPITMVRAIAAAAVCAALSVGAAHANPTVKFRDVLKPNGHERSKAEKLADGDACGASGPAHTIDVTMPVFEKCMREKGYELDHYGPDLSTPFHGTLGSYTDTIGDADGHLRDTAALHADELACKERKAVSIDNCLGQAGWQLIYTQHSPAPRRPAREVPAPDPTWIDPDTGERCYNTGFATICGN
jgi:hypothetical protein